MATPDVVRVIHGDGRMLIVCKLCGSAHSLRVGPDKRLVGGSLHCPHGCGARDRAEAPKVMRDPQPR